MEAGGRKSAPSHFGERVMFMTKGLARRSNGPPEYGYGLVARSNQVDVGTSEGVMRAWTIRRTGGHDGWKQKHILAVEGTTRKPGPGREGEDAHIRIEGERSLGKPPQVPPAAPPNRAQLSLETTTHHIAQIYGGVQRVHCHQHGARTLGRHTDACTTRKVTIPDARTGGAIGGTQGCQLGAVHGTAGPGEETAGSKWSRGIGSEWRANATLTHLACELPGDDMGYAHHQAASRRKCL